MKIIIISGRSGSGKSTALHALEDAGYNCIDNFPVTLLQSLVSNTLEDPTRKDSRMAVCIDARSRDLPRFPEILLSIQHMDVDCQVIYLDARSPTLVKRFSETRRRHPLTNTQTDLRQAIDAEAKVLASIADLANLTIDTTQLRAQSLIDNISSRVAQNTAPGISLLFRSFGFKYGVPVDADQVFDVRCLPNPHWIEELRPLTGMDPAVIEYLRDEPLVENMFNDITTYLTHWLPRFEAQACVYMTVAVGCTGGQHRSVYLAERLAAFFASKFANVLVRHREMTTLAEQPASRWIADDELLTR